MIAFASAGALKGCQPRFPPPIPLVQPHADHQLGLSILHTFTPPGITLTKLQAILHRHLLHPFQGNLGHSPRKLWTRYKIRQSSKLELLFNEAAHCSANHLVLRSSLQEVGAVPKIPDLIPITQTWQQPFFWATERPPPSLSLKHNSLKDSDVNPCTLFVF